MSKSGIPTTPLTSAFIYWNIVCLIVSVKPLNWWFILLLILVDNLVNYIAKRR